MPRQFQNWARSLLEERKTLKEQNSLLKSNSTQVGEQLNNFEAKLNSSAEQLRQTERTRLKLENELENLNTKLLNAERELTQERAKNQQMKLDMDDADSMAATWNKKFAEKSAQLESSKQRCCELDTELFQLQEQIATLQGQLRSLQVCWIIIIMKVIEWWDQKERVYMVEVTILTFGRFIVLKKKRKIANKWTKLTLATLESDN